MTNKINDQSETRIRMGEIIKEARLKKGLTQSELGKMLGKSDNVVTNWEKGTNSPDVESIQSLCGILDIPVSDMFKPRENRTRPERHSPVGTRMNDRLIMLWRRLPYEEQIKMLGRIEDKLEECEGHERA